MRNVPCFILVLLPCMALATFNVGDQILARWTNHLYYAGKVSEFPSPGMIKVKFNDGYEITHSVDDGTAFIADVAPDAVDVRDHVLATWSGNSKYYFGFVIEKTTKYKVQFDDGDSAWYKAEDLRIFPVLDKPEVGARVFAAWYNKLYYRGFVVKATDSAVTVKFDDGSKRTFSDTEWETYIVLDELPSTSQLFSPRERVIAYWPGERSYFLGRVTKKKNGATGRQFYVKSRGRKRWEEFYQIRMVQ